LDGFKSLNICIRQLKNVKSPFLLVMKFELETKIDGF